MEEVHGAFPEFPDPWPVSCLTTVQNLSPRHDATCTLAFCGPSSSCTRRPPCLLQSRPGSSFLYSCVASSVVCVSWLPSWFPLPQPEDCRIESGLTILMRIRGPIFLVSHPYVYTGALRPSFVVARYFGQSQLLQYSEFIHLFLYHRREDFVGQKRCSSRQVELPDTGRVLLWGGLISTLKYDGDVG